MGRNRGEGGKTDCAIIVQLLENLWNHPMYFRFRKSRVDLLEKMIIIMKLGIMILMRHVTGGTTDLNMKPLMWKRTESANKMPVEKRKPRTFFKLSEIPFCCRDSATFMQ